MNNHAAASPSFGNIGSADSADSVIPLGDADELGLLTLLTGGGRSTLRRPREGGVSMKPKPFLLAFEQAFGAKDAAPALDDGLALPRQRRKLWELPISWHCTLVGTCLTVTDLRNLMRHGKAETLDAGDYGLHSYVVNHCGARNGMTEEIHRVLNQRHANVLRRFARLKGGDALLAAWKNEFAAGNIAAGLWAAWTHGDLGEYEGSVIYGDLHMLSHQVCAHGQPSQIRIAELEKENTRQGGEIARLRHELTTLRNERAQRVAELDGRVAELEGQFAVQRQNEAAFAAANKIAKQNQTLRERGELLNERLAAVESRSQAQQLRIRELENELTRARSVTQRPAEAALEPQTAQAAAPLSVAYCPPEIRLDGRRILCVGGRPGLIEHYRRLVEASGGCFIHHDGGQEDNEHRIDVIVANVDVVFCQVGYLSHPSYWRIKEACKQRGLPCIFQKSGGVTAFSRDLEMFAESAESAERAENKARVSLTSRRILFGQSSGYSA